MYIFRGSVRAMYIRNQIPIGAGSGSRRGWSGSGRRCVGASPAEIAREDLEGLIERSAVLLEREKHRLIHGSDWRWWGRRGGLATLRRYGTSWFTMLAPYRWGKVSEADLEAARPVRG